jgi:hypothetical protein
VKGLAKHAAIFLAVLLATWIAGVLIASLFIGDIGVD